MRSIFLFTAFIFHTAIATQFCAYAQNRAFSIHARMFGGVGGCSNKKAFSEASTRRIAGRPATCIELTGGYRLVDDRVLVSTGLGLNNWRYDVQLRDELINGIRYEDSRQGPGGSSFSIPLRIGVHMGRAWTVEIGAAYLRHVGTTPVANDLYTFNNGASTLRGESANYAQRFGNHAGELTISYAAGRHFSLQARASTGFQAFPGVRVTENFSEGNDVTLYNTQGAAKLAFVYAGVGYKF